jgi:hypothetical protein
VAIEKNIVGINRKIRMSIAIVVPNISSRLSYVLDWLFGKQLQIEYEIFTKFPVDTSFQVVIHYGDDSKNTFRIPNAGLLFDNNIESQNINIGSWNNTPTLFASTEQNDTIPFDIFSAIFYLLSRYEEYLPFNPDKHNRYPATESILYKNNCLEQPVVDEWVFHFRKLLCEKGVVTKQNVFAFLPTYDIDIAWSYLHKGWIRNIGGYCRDFFRNKIALVKERTSVLSGHKKDPFDSFGFLELIHQQNQLHPIYFILASLDATDFDKNITPFQEDMRALIAQLSAANMIGIHPSYYTEANIVKAHQEKIVLEEIIGKQIIHARQHYIKLHLPDTYRQLIELGIELDYSMGYATHLGFRAGTSHRYSWYDLLHETATELTVIPFCFMDATAHYELKLNAVEAFDRLTAMQQRLQKINGTLITVFHNFSLGTDKDWEGWQEKYTLFLQSM